MMVGELVGMMDNQLATGWVVMTARWKVILMVDVLVHTQAVL
jgi:hypothetical protein